MRLIEVQMHMNNKHRAVPVDPSGLWQYISRFNIKMQMET